MQQYFVITDNTLLWKVMIDCTKYVTEQWAEIKKKKLLQINFGCELHTFTEKNRDER